ncbi:MAG: hypothetical protein KGM42_16275 [Hyphomicrobiales bacterium]|nr:hypothetical protein [Hyphomicrobiales bacterium]
MTEIRTVTTLRRKRDEILAVIRLYERQLDQARADLAHVNAAMRIFQIDEREHLPAYLDMHRVFTRKEKWPVIEAALREGVPLTTRELAVRLMRWKGLDTSDAVMSKAVSNLLIHSLRMAQTRGKVEMIGKRKGVCVWQLAARPSEQPSLSI